MAQHHDHRGTIVPQRTNFDNADQPGIAQPFSQSEIEELLFGDERSAEERLQRLQEIRDELVARGSADFGDKDPEALLAEIDRAIEALSVTSNNADETNDYAGLAAPLGRDPADHLDALSPDDIDARHALEGEDEMFDDEDVEEPEWDEGDDFRPEHGTH
ncbi:hypothetical protein VW29_18980 [Devosia limi DSM 17137]|uniref:Uncharacterized protein n=1 Tax=Devosia limi DSM 17137 TaxID=1121477 RepID=A0A0F5L4C8_9HYPH|nr:hypothetical protein [Devosia limi]KKB77044.1 hypothetical protein VW29_18980 [Devosia limi DSM 17137]SHF42280.1 hypothetical protein SAMN02745223_02616 [Devosia limi DSM 17137]